VTGEKVDIPTSAGRVSHAQPEIEMYTRVFTKHKLLITSSYSHIMSYDNAKSIVVQTKTLLKTNFLTFK